MKIPSGAARSLAKSFGNSSKSFAKAAKIQSSKLIKHTGNKIKSNQFLNNTRDKFKRNKYKYLSATESESDDVAVSNRNSSPTFKKSKRKLKSNDIRLKYRDFNGRNSKVKKSRSSPANLNSITEEEEQGSHTEFTSDADDEQSFLSRSKSRHNNKRSNPNNNIKSILKGRNQNQEQRKRKRPLMSIREEHNKVSNYQIVGESEEVPLKYKILVLFLFLLVASCIIGLIFIGIGDQISKRYSWYTYEPKVQALIITFGLASAFGIIFVLLICITQLNALKTNNPNSSIFILVIVALIFSLIALICAIVQKSTLDTTFLDGFIRIIESYFQYESEKIVLDKIQTEFECCGIEDFEDWKDLEKEDVSYVTGFVPFSCCDIRSQRPCVHETIYNWQFSNYEPEEDDPSSFTIYKTGCLAAMQTYYKEFLDIAIYLALIYAGVEVGILILFVLSYNGS